MAKLRCPFLLLKVWPASLTGALVDVQSGARPRPAERESAVPEGCQVAPKDVTVWEMLVLKDRTCQDPKGSSHDTEITSREECPGEGVLLS